MTRAGGRDAGVQGHQRIPKRALIDDSPLVVGPTSVPFCHLAPPEAMPAHACEWPTSFVPTVSGAVSMLRRHGHRKSDAIQVRRTQHAAGAAATRDTEDTAPRHFSLTYAQATKLRLLS